VFCSILTKHRPPTKNWWKKPSKPGEIRLPPPPITKTALSGTKKIKLRPKKKKRYRISLGKLKQFYSGYGDAPTFLQSFKVNGKDVFHYDTNAQTAGSAWLTMLRTLKDRSGFTIKDPSKPRRGWENFRAPDDFLAIPQRKRNRLVRMVWKKIRGYYRRYHPGNSIYTIYIYGKDKYIQIGEIKNGRFKKK